MNNFLEHRNKAPTRLRCLRAENRRFGSRWAGFPRLSSPQSVLSSCFSEGAECGVLGAMQLNGFACKGRPLRGPESHQQCLLTQTKGVYYTYHLEYSFVSAHFYAQIQHSVCQTWSFTPKNPSVRKTTSVPTLLRRMSKHWRLKIIELDSPDTPISPEMATTSAAFLSL